MVRLLAAVVVFFPLSLVRVDQRGAALSPLVIQLEKNSPAFAAFEDLQNDYAEAVSYEFAKETVRLSSGEAYLPELSSPAPSPTMILSLKPLKIKKQPELLAETPTWENSEDLPSLQKRKQILLAGLSKEVLRQPSASERAKQLVQDELSRRNESERKVPTSNGGTIIVRKESSSEGGYSPYVSHNRRQRSSINENKFNESQGDLLVTGDLRVHGVPDMGIHSKWRIYREVNNRKAETGSVNITVDQAQFSIRVDEKKGSIVAELTDRSGHIIGRGQVSLANNDLALHVKPVDSTTVAAYVPSLVNPSEPNAVAANYKPYGKSLLENQSDTSLDVSQYTDSSRFFIEAGTKHHYPTVVIGFLSALKQIPLYTNKVIQAFRSIVKSFYKPIDIQNLALVWGSILKDGKPVEGASIEMAGIEGKVIYFNEIGIPRAELGMTTSSGQFAIANVPEGVQSVRVIHGGYTYPAQVFPSFSGKLTQLELEIPSHSIDQFFKVFSVIGSANHVPTSLRIVGSEDIFDLNSESKISIPVMSGGVIIETDSGSEYELLRTHLPRLTEKVAVDLPAIPVQWINQLVQSSSKVLDRRLGWALGFVGDSEAEVKLLNNQQSLHQIIYFDENLKIQAGNQAPAGGGYLAFNLPLGYQTLEIRPLHSIQSHVESFVSEPHFLHLVGSQRFIQPLRQENF